MDPQKCTSTSYYTPTNHYKAGRNRKNFHQELGEQNFIRVMERKGLGFCFFFLLIIFFASQEKIVMLAEARPRVCQSASRGYHGPCLRSHNCALVCRNEGFSGGQCHGFRRRCFCTKLC